MSYRKERIERLLEELRYEVERGMMDGEIDESLGFRFIVPVSKSIPSGVVACEFRTRPIPHYSLGAWDMQKPTLKVIEGGGINEPDAS